MDGLKRMQGNQTLYRKLIISLGVSCSDTLIQIRSAISRRIVELVETFESDILVKLAEGESR